MKSANPPQASKLLLIGLSGLLTHCATHPPLSSVPDTAGWSGKVRIEDRAKNKTHTANVDFTALKGRSLRMDVTAGLGIYVGSLVLNQDEVQYLLARERKFVSGAATDRVLEPILGVPLNPRLLENALFEIEPKPSWTCERDEGVLKRCASADGQIEMVWKERNHAGKTVLINSPKVGMILRLGNPKTDIQFGEQTFRLTAPSGYKQYRLQTRAP